MIRHHHDGIQIWQGDNAVLLADIADDSVDLVVTSPPYDSLRQYGGHGWSFATVAAQLSRITKVGGVAVWIVNDQTHNGSKSGSSFQHALGFMQLGWKLVDTMVYATNKPPANCTYRYQPAFEFMFVLSLSDMPKTFSPIMEKCLWGGVGTSPTQRDKQGRLVSQGRRRINDQKPRTNIWKYETGSGKTRATKHPAPFPLALARDVIKSWTLPGDLVVDPFLGSGTTTEAARELGRKAIGIEIHEPYVNEAIDRLSQPLLFS